jgi:hypothetical protein
MCLPTLLFAPAGMKKILMQIPLSRAEYQE